MKWQLSASLLQLFDLFLLFRVCVVLKLQKQVIRAIYTGENKTRLE